MDVPESSSESLPLPDRTEFTETPGAVTVAVFATSRVAEGATVAAGCALTVRVVS